MSEHSQEEQLLLETVWRLFTEDRSWPSFAVVDRELDRANIDAEAVLELLPAGKVRGTRWVNSAPDRPVELDVRALAGIPAASSVLAYLVRVLRFMAEAHRDFEPDPDGPHELTVRSDEVADHLAATEFPRSREVLAERTRRLGPLLRQIPVWTSFGSSPDGEWTVTVNRRLRGFREISSVDDFFARLDMIESPPVVAKAIVPTDPRQQPGLEEAMTQRMPDIDPRAVFVVHGRDLEAKAALTDYLRALDLRPLEWEELVAATGTAAPYVGDAVSIAFRLAQAVIVLVTPDDEARLHPDLRGQNEPDHELHYTGQPRPNVLFEAGMALASHPDRTVIAIAGDVRPWSDVAGRHTVHLTGAAASLHALALRLENAGCAVNRTGSDWLDGTKMSALAAHSRRAHVAGEVDQSPREDLPRGHVLPAGPPASAAPRLTARLLPNGNDYLLEIANRGGCVLTDVSFEFPESAHWHLALHVLPEYPIARLEPRDHVRVPVTLSLQSAQITQTMLSGSLESGERYETSSRVSVYG